MNEISEPSGVAFSHHTRTPEQLLGRASCYCGLSAVSAAGDIGCMGVNRATRRTLTRGSAQPPDCIAPNPITCHPDVTAIAHPSAATAVGNIGCIA